MLPHAHRRPAPRSSRSPRLLGFALLFTIALPVGACSVLVESETNQCATDADCERFGNHPLCVEGLCVPSGLGPPGCFLGAPTTDDQYQNQCTGSQCERFDNCARLGLCGAAELPPLIDPPPPSP